MNEQRLIVEGKDAIVLTQILIQRGISPPQGYSSRRKYVSEFVKSSGGIDKINIIIREEL